MKAINLLAIPVWVLALNVGGGIAHASPSLRAEEDGQFLVKAAAVSRKEATDAQAAARSTRRVAIKQTARSIANDHVWAGQRLAVLAKSKGMKMPVDAAPATDDEAGMGASEATSDAARIAGLLKAHEHAVALFYQEAVRGMDPDVKRFAEVTLPTLQRRLQVLRSLQDAYPETSAG